MRRLVNIIGDFLLCARNRHEHEQRVTEILKRIERAGVKLEGNELDLSVPVVDLGKYGFRKTMHKNQERRTGTGIYL